MPPAPQVARDKLVALGTCIGKFTHSGKFRVTIGALDLLAQYAKYKVGCAAALMYCRTAGLWHAAVVVLVHAAVQRRLYCNAAHLRMPLPAWAGR